MYTYIQKCIIICPSVHLHDAQGMQRLPGTPVDPSKSSPHGLTVAIGG